VTRRRELALNSQIMLTQASSVGVRLMVSYRALDEGADPLFLGMLAASFAVPALCTALPAGRLADRVGGSAVTLTGLLIAALGIAAMLLLPGNGPLLACSAAVGLGHLLAMVGQQAYVAHASTTQASDSAFGALAAAASLGQLVGPLAVTWVSSMTSAADARPDTSAGLLLSLALSVAAMPAYLWLRAADLALAKNRLPNGHAAGDMRVMLSSRGLWRLLAVSGAVLVTVDLMYAFVPLWAIEQDISAAAVGALLALRAAVSMVSRIGLGQLTRRFGRKPLLIVSIAAAAISLIALPMVGIFGAALAMIGLGLGLGIPQPLTMSWVVALTKPSLHGAALGLRMTVNQLAQIGLPLGVGAVAAPLGVVGIFWANAALLAGAIAIVAGSEAGPVAPAAETAP
jgi:MFS family permease